ncbi:cell division protein FtsB [Vibrio sp. SS-MA-C1-2]|uniref:cell division protein FtsB n=1 Tax=Vibrio sp. SS-MA-C1-2 TaxID=2908646 RepID=UPI001F29619C|nr:cell division protein FtsB [Vibrio sp. SS-MA-C1-2]UJF19022.1 cell division protein FtsB [Vibrio sp. SS-MA-C1-2]
MRLLNLFLLIIVGWLVATLIYGKNGISDYFAVQNDVVRETSANELLKQRNQQMFAEIKDLRSGDEAIEERARNQLGLIKKDEVFYRIISDKNSTWFDKER